MLQKTEMAQLPREVTPLLLLWMKISSSISPAAMDLAEAGPLLCAGVTVYSPLRRWGVTTGMKVAILGMGGLGHIAVKLAKALGAEVTVFTTSPDKVADAKRFGATNVVINKEGADFSSYNHSL
jgi:uncharacterized zinc-type alcohol dehydrogenase-like protein